MYKQSINNIKVAIIPLDGTIFDLNRYRYNYYHHLCDQKNINISKQDFYSHLSNMYDMYNTLPLDGKVDTGPLNAKIEREMHQYLTYKGIKPKEGFIELLEYLHQKEIQVAVISTHRTKDAVEYLQMAKLYNSVHFIIGSDTSSLPLPSTQMLETVMQHFQVSSQETLVLSSFVSLNQVASELNMNIIYCEDLVSAGYYERETSFKTAQNLFEVLNILLFDRFEEAEIYSPILGMSSDMNIDELNQVKEELEEKYHNDSQILNVIDQTYSYHLSQLDTPHSQEETILVNKVPEKRTFYFDDEVPLSHQHLSESSLLDEESVNDIQETVSQLNDEEEDELTSLLQQINKKPIHESTVKKVTDYEEIENIVKSSQEELLENDEDSEESSFILSFVVNIFYIFALSFLILFIGLIIYVSFIHGFSSKEGIFGIVVHIFNIYSTLIESFFSLILNGLHSLLNFIPSYQQYITSQQLFSADGIQLFQIFVFQSLLIGIVKVIIFIVKRSSQHENDYS